MAGTSKNLILKKPSDGEALEKERMKRMYKSLATTEERQPERCQVCEFPAIAGQIQGEVDSEKYSLRLCPSCFKYALLCLRDSYRQNRLFDDDFEIEELCKFGRVKRD